MSTGGISVLIGGVTAKIAGEPKQCARLHFVCPKMNGVTEGAVVHVVVRAVKAAAEAAEFPGDGCLVIKSHHVRVARRG